MADPVSRFSAITRRAFLEGASMAVLLGLAGCTDGDQALAPETVPPETPTATWSATAPSPGTSGVPVPDGAEAVVLFTYTAGATEGGRGPGGGRGGVARNPYIAVWVEDAEGALLQTIAVWHLQGGQDRWLAELRRWYQLSGGDDTGSSATRPAGSHNLFWDLGSGSGRLHQGRYWVCIEASREHGPYSLIREEIELGDQALTHGFTPVGELTSATLLYTP